MRITQRNCVNVRNSFPSLFSEFSYSAGSICRVIYPTAAFSGMPPARLVSTVWEKQKHPGIFLLRFRSMTSLGDSDWDTHKYLYFSLAIRLLCFFRLYFVVQSDPGIKTSIHRRRMLTTKFYFIFRLCLAFRSTVARRSYSPSRSNVFNFYL